ncbi:MAG: hypothetical protein ACRDPD_01045 [Streptosporangiaceae bacterium]
MARSGGVAGPYQIQALLAAAHSTAPSWQETGWDRIGLEYSHLWHAALADNLGRLGRMGDAAGELHTAVTLAPSDVEQRLLQGRLRTVRSELG